MALRQRSSTRQGVNRAREARPRASQEQEAPLPLPIDVLHMKIDEMVEFLLYKYSNKELTTRAEMLHSFMKDHKEHFTLIFTKVCDCLYMVFGIDVKELDPPGHIYSLVPVLGLTYNEIVGEDHSIAKTGLLVMIISIIFRRGNRASEETVWLTLNRMQVFDGVEHYVYGEPRKFITEDLVQEGYVVYHQIPDSNPARYEFLWGPRTYAETTKMKVLEHLAKVNNRDPWSYPSLYEDALREQQEAAHGRRMGC
ncbi:melanoma-associated antigen 10-like [Cavia porcellus]|uniref:melanoma-associated antigen 10-like n=1 Tax=Cavia porcellus TaxID=10141 RepID=UPI00022B2A0B